MSGVQRNVLGESRRSPATGTGTGQWDGIGSPNHERQTPTNLDQWHLGINRKQTVVPRKPFISYW